MKYWILPSFAGALAVITPFEPRAAVFSILLLVIAFATTTRAPTELRPRLRWVLGAASSCALFGMTRFIIKEAMPGIAEARGRESSQRAVSRLREILFAEDAMRRYAMIDPDGDRVGSAGFLSELSGATRPRSGRPLEIPPLSARFAPTVITRQGPAYREDNYLYIVCLPTPTGGFTAVPTDLIDEERAETTWVAYAWPASRGASSLAVLFIDQDERILEASQVAESALWIGPESGPSCLAALDGESAALFRAWRGKTPRKSMPGLDGGVP